MRLMHIVAAMWKEIATSVGRDDGHLRIADFPASSPA